MSCSLLPEYGGKELCMDAQVTVLVFATNSDISNLKFCHTRQTKVKRLKFYIFLIILYREEKYSKFLSYHQINCLFYEVAESYP